MNLKWVLVPCLKAWKLSPILLSPFPVMGTLCSWRVSSWHREVLTWGMRWCGSEHEAILGFLCSYPKVFFFGPSVFQKCIKWALVLSQLLVFVDPLSYGWSLWQYGNWSLLLPAPPHLGDMSPKLGYWFPVAVWEMAREKDARIWLEFCGKTTWSKAVGKIVKGHECLLTPFYNWEISYRWASVRLSGWPEII